MKKAGFIKRSAAAVSSVAMIFSATIAPNANAAVIDEKIPIITITMLKRFSSHFASMMPTSAEIRSARTATIHGVKIVM